MKWMLYRLERQLPRLAAILWQFPQWLLGVIIGLFLHRTWKYYVSALGAIHLWYVKEPLGISLGPLVYVGEDTIANDPWTNQHEYGHCRQSLMLGPLYLLVVGVPSLVMNLLTMWGVLRRENYYNRFPENWADSLGSVRR